MHTLKCLLSILFVIVTAFTFSTTSLAQDPPPGMVLIPEGGYERGGSLISGYAVYIGNFHIDIYEVTNEEYCSFLNLSGAEVIFNRTAYTEGGDIPLCMVDDGEPDRGWIHWTGSSFTPVSGKGNHPIMSCCWYGAAVYANWLSAVEGRTPCYNTETWACNFDADGYRLPTCAEWEKAARGGEYEPYYQYPWGDSIEGSNANYAMSGDPFDGTYPYPETTPVGYYDGNQMPPGDNMANGYGIYDMTGNVPEWCNDWWGSYDYNEWLNPRGPTYGTHRYQRGGGYRNGAGNEVLRIDYSDPKYPNMMGYGFRLVLGPNSGLGSDIYTIDTGLNCIPQSGTLPFSTNMQILLSNVYYSQSRRIAAQINVHLGGGGFISNWRSGYKDLPAWWGGYYYLYPHLPAYRSLLGDNVLQIVAQDVTPPPYNQPPYPPAGDTDTATFTVTGIAP